MAEQIISPGVFTRENDLTFLPQGIGQIGAAIVGPTVKGPALVPTVVTSYSEYQSIFGDTFKSGSNSYTYLTSLTAKEYLRNAGRLNVFQLLKKKKTHKIHVMSYNNGGYYNWHTDTEYFTFNLILNQGDQLRGGDMMFMDDGRVIEIPNQNNMMVVFPSYINHAITPLKSEDGNDVPFPQQRFSIQYWVKCN